MEPDALSHIGHSLVVARDGKLVFLIAYRYGDSVAYLCTEILCGVGLDSYLVLVLRCAAFGVSVLACLIVDALQCKLLGGLAVELLLAGYELLGKHSCGHSVVGELFLHFLKLVCLYLSAAAVLCECV